MSVQSEIIDPAFNDLGITAEGETASATALANALLQLNQMISGWSNEEGTVFDHRKSTFSLAANTKSYTMGAGSTWDTTVRSFGVVAARAYSGLFEQGLQVLPMDQFTTQIANSQGITATLPSLLGQDKAYPANNVAVHPTPNASASIDVYYWVALTPFATLAATVSLPEGYAFAMRKNLAVLLADSYGRPLTESLAAAAQNAKAEIAFLRKPPAAAVQQQTSQ